MIIPMKQQIFIVLFSVSIFTCYGQELITRPNENTGLNSSHENFQNYSGLNIKGGATENDSYRIIRSTLGAGGFSKTITTNKGIYIICQSVDQTSVIGTFNKKGYTFMQGFQQPFVSAKKFQLALENDLQASLYPNPFAHYINLSFDDPVTSEVFLQVTDITGKILYKNKFPAVQLINLPLDHIPPGVYVLKVVTGNKQFRANLIKQ